MLTLWQGSKQCRKKADIFVKETDFRFLETKLQILPLNFQDDTGDNIPHLQNWYSNMDFILLRGLSKVMFAKHQIISYTWKKWNKWHLK